jgi:hypothetical protein
MILSAIALVGPVALPCCTYVERVMRRAYGDALVERSPGSAWNLWYPDKDPWSPATAALQAGAAVELVERPLPGAWHVAQGWRTVPSTTGSGHTFLVFAPVTGGDQLLVADSIGPSKADPDGRSATIRGTTWPALVREFVHGLRLARLRRPAAIEG